MSLQFALLGLISSYQPVSGYDLTKTFRRSMSHYWHARHGQIYPLLEKMRRAGMIEVEAVEQKDRPNKKVYSITKRGRADLLEWLRAERKPIQMKNEGLLKTRFFAHLPREECEAQLREERAVYEEMLDRYVDMESAYFAETSAGVGSDDVLFAHFTLKRGITFLQGSIAWCDWCLAALERTPRRDPPSEKPHDPPKKKPRAKKKAV